MTIIHTDLDQHTAEPIERPIHRGLYRARHIEQARRLALHDPHRPVDGETIRLTGSRIIVVITGNPHLTAIPGRVSEYTWECRVAPASATRAICHQQIEAIEASLRRAATQSGQAA